ncbi:hypothetical protein MASR2M29_14170 [Spirochaetota bacterium]
MYKYKLLIISLVLCLTANMVFAQNIVLQIGSTAPANSPWDLGLKKLAAEWSSISGGRVKIAFPKSVSSSSQEDLIQKLKFNLDGVILDTTGLGLIENDAYFLSMPSVIRNNSEYDTVMNAAIPLIKNKIGDRYEFIAAAKGGWIYFFSNQEINTPDDLRKVRMGVNRNMENITRLFQSIGVRTVKADSSSTLLQFNSGALDAMYSSPLFVAALWSQYKRVISHMTAYPLAPFFGALIINSRSWNRIPDDLKARLIASAEKVFKEIGEQSDKLEMEAIGTMKANGLTVSAASELNNKIWNSFYNEKLNSDVIMWFSEDFVKSILKVTGR